MNLQLISILKLLQICIYILLLALNFSTLLNLCRGYWAPEYMMWGQLSEKTDVYSFGVLLLEIVSGKRAIDMSLHEEDIHLPNRVSFLRHGVPIVQRFVLLRFLE